MKDAARSDGGQLLGEGYWPASDPHERPMELVGTTGSEDAQLFGESTPLFLRVKASEELREGAHSKRLQGLEPPPVLVGGLLGPELGDHGAEHDLSVG